MTDRAAVAATAVTWAVDGSDAAVATHVARTVARPGAKTIAMPGGGTPRPILTALATRDLPWDTVTIMPGDERDVAPGHPASNVGMLVRILGETGAHLVPLLTGVALPRFDLVWLGMGSDGHVASLFPGSDLDPAAAPAVIEVTPDPLPPDAPFARRTLNLAALANTADVIVVIRGRAKRALLAAAAAGQNDLPIARLLRLTPATVYWAEA